MKSNVFEPVHYRYLSEVGQLADYCRCLIQYHSMLQQLQQAEPMSLPAFVLYPDESFSLLHSLIELYNGTRLKLLRLKVQQEQLSVRPVIKDKSHVWHGSFNLEFIEKKEDAKKRFRFAQERLNDYICETIKNIEKKFSSEICRKVDELPKEERVLFIEKYINHKNTNEIAEEYYLNRKTVRKKLLHSLQTMVQPV